MADSRRVAQPQTWPRPKQQATLYDAVAGRVGYEGFLTEQQSSRYRDTASTSQIAVPPEEVLFRRKGAPVRYAEDDIYEADRHLLPHQRLPDSDLLKIIHAYVADYYASTPGEGKLDHRSMDETALLAMGILVEEAATEFLGKTGDLAFVEAAETQHDDVSGRTYLYDGQLRRKLVTRPAKRRAAGPHGGRQAADVDTESGDDRSDGPE